MQIIRRLELLRAAEHQNTCDLIEALLECQRSESHLALGYSSIFDFLVRHLHYSNAAASRRYKAMKCARRFPQVLTMLREHRTNLSALAMAEATLAQAENPEQLLGRIDGQPQREVERVIAREHPTPRKRERVQRSFEQPTETLWDSQPEPEERVRIFFSMSPEDHALLEEARGRLSRKYPQGVTLEVLMRELLQRYLKPTRSEPKPKPARRRIPKSVREEVTKRDGGRCRFVGPNGQRCDSTHELQIDHIRPWARGGDSSLENLRLLCGAHNRHLGRGQFSVPQRN